jgi:tellurite resistance protein
MGAAATDSVAALIARLQESPQRLADSIRAVALWLAVVDGPLDPREFHEVGLALTHEPEGVPMQDIAAAFAAEPLSTELPKLFRFLRGQRSPKRSESLLDLFIRVAAADGRISQVERHALVFLSDLLAAPATLLRERFESLLGIEFESPADLSDPGWYDTAEAAARARASQQQARVADAALARRADEERREALLVLGLKADATPIAIKAAWRRLSRQHHPDRQPQGDPDILAAAAARFDAVQKAWTWLREDLDA